MIAQLETFHTDRYLIVHTCDCGLIIAQQVIRVIYQEAIFPPLLAPVPAHQLDRESWTPEAAIFASNRGNLSDGHFFTFTSSSSCSAKTEKIAARGGHISEFV